MGKHLKRRNVNVMQRHESSIREMLEKKWFGKIEFADEYARLVTQAGNKPEPYHRWLPYRQGFSPALVRRFLEMSELPSGPIIDPFSGSGTTVIECAKLGREAIGLDAMPSLVFLLQTRFAASALASASGPDEDDTEFSEDEGAAGEDIEDGEEPVGDEGGADSAEDIADFEAGGDEEEAAFDEVPLSPFFSALANSAQWTGEWNELYKLADNQLERAAVLCAASRSVNGEGRPLNGCPPPARMTAECLNNMERDLRHPLPPLGMALLGDARSLPLADESCAGVLTSPPYISKYDYTRVVAPMEELYSNAHSLEQARLRQVRSNPRCKTRKWTMGVHPAVAEACDRMHEGGNGRSAGLIRGYFEDMAMVVLECARVLKPGAAITAVVAGANLDDVYVPADLVFAELCEASGLDVEEIIQARTLVDRGKRLGGIVAVPPRECIVTARK